MGLKVLKPCFSLSKMCAFTSAIKQSHLDKQGLALHQGLLGFGSSHKELCLNLPKEGLSFSLFELSVLTRNQTGFRPIRAQSSFPAWHVGEALILRPPFSTPPGSQMHLCTQESENKASSQSSRCFSPRATWVGTPYLGLHFAFPEQHPSGKHTHNPTDHLQLFLRTTLQEAVVSNVTRCPSLVVLAMSVGRSQV